MQITKYNVCFRDGCGIIMVIFTQVFFIALVSSSIMVLFTQGVALHYPSHSAASVLSVKVEVVRAPHYANIDGVASMDYQGQFNGLRVTAWISRNHAVLLDNWINWNKCTKITIYRFGLCQDKKNPDQRTSEQQSSWKQFLEARLTLTIFARNIRVYFSWSS